MKWEFKLVKSNSYLTDSITLKQTPGIMCRIHKQDMVVPLSIDGVPTQRDIALMEEFCDCNIGLIMYDHKINKSGMVV